jgi:hypothetical protein
MIQPRPLVPTSSHLVRDDVHWNLVPSSLPLQGDEVRDEIHERGQPSNLVPTRSRHIQPDGQPLPSSTP